METWHFEQSKNGNSGVYIVCAVLIINWTNEMNCRRASQGAHCVSLRALYKYTRFSSPNILEIWGSVDLQPLTQDNSLSWALFQ